MTEEKRDDPSASSNPEHLIVFVHGLNGIPANWAVLMGRMSQKLDLQTTVLRASAVNKYRKTFDGIDVCGARLATEIKAMVASLPGMKRISFVAHSLGGLFTRFAIGHLFDTASGTICGLKPCHFITMATPHLGCHTGGPSQIPLIGWLSGISKKNRRWQSMVTNASLPIAWRVAGRSGMQLFLTDEDNGAPVVELLTRDEPGGQPYFSALAAFQTRTVYANSQSDHIVSWSNASVREEHELPDLKLHELSKVRGVVRDEGLPAAFADARAAQVALAFVADADAARDECKPPAGAGAPAAGDSAWILAGGRSMLRCNTRSLAVDAPGKVGALGLLGASASAPPPTPTSPPPGLHGVARSAVSAPANVGMPEASTREPPTPMPASAKARLPGQPHPAASPPRPEPPRPEHGLTRDSAAWHASMSGRSLRLSWYGVLVQAVCCSPAGRSRCSRYEPAHAPQAEPVAAPAVPAADGSGRSETGSISTPNVRVRPRDLDMLAALEVGKELVPQMLQRLQKLNWRRVDVHWRDTLFPLMAHNHIQVTRKWLNWKGGGVADHVVEQVLLMEEVLACRQLDCGSSSPLPQNATHPPNAAATTDAPASGGATPPVDLRTEVSA